MKKWKSKKKKQKKKNTNENKKKWEKMKEIIHSYKFLVPYLRLAAFCLFVNFHILATIKDLMLSLTLKLIIVNT